MHPKTLIPLFKLISFVHFALSTMQNEARRLPTAKIASSRALAKFDVQAIYGNKRNPTGYANFR